MLATRVLMFGFAAAVLFGVRASGATIDVDTILGPDHPYLNETITVVDGDSPPTIVQVIDGAIIGGELDEFPSSVGIDAFGQSVVEVHGGRVRGFEQAILLHDHAVLRMQGGMISSAPIELRDESKAFLDGGHFGAYWVYDSGLVEVRHGGGSGRALENARIVQYSGGSDDIFLYDDSTFVMHGGAINFTLETNGNSRALINGGTIGGLALAVLNDESVLTLRGGPQIADFRVNDEALLHVYGSGLEFVFEDDEHFVQGTLADGSEANFRYRLADQDRIILHEVPEPATWGMLAIGVAGIAVAGWNRARASKSRR